MDMTMEEGAEEASVVVLQLPEDIMFDIFTHMKLPELLACRQGCQSWRNLVHRSTFAPLQRRRSNTISGYLLNRLNRNQHATDFLPLHLHSSSSSIPAPPSFASFLPAPVNHLEIEAAGSRGLCLAVNHGRDYSHGRKQSHYYICRPVTQQWREIPRPRVRFFTVGIGMAVAPCTGRRLDLRILRLSQGKKHPWILTICELFDSRVWKWKRVADFPEPKLIMIRKPGVAANGGICWASDTRKGIHCFDLAKEEWKFIPGPGTRSSSPNWWFLTQCQGRLYWVHDELEEVKVWWLAGEQRWERVIVVNKATICKQTCSKWCTLRDIIYAPAVALLQTDGGRLIWFNLESHEWSNITGDFLCGAAGYIKFESDMLPICMDSRY